MNIDVAFIISALKDEGSACLASSASGFSIGYLDSVKHSEMFR